MNYPRIIAHRGGGGLAPENTLAGLRLAARLGCRAVEFDVMLSRDEMPVLHHDETLERCTNGAGAVAQRDFSQLRLLDAARGHAGFTDERIPALVDALALCRELKLWVNVEIKSAADHAAATGRVVGETLNRLSWQGGVLSSFSAEALAAARAAAPHVPCALLVAAIPADWHERLLRAGAAALHCEAAATGMKRVHEVVAAGFPVAVYTVNRREEAERWFALGARAIFTDRPDLFAPEEM